MREAAGNPVGLAAAREGIAALAARSWLIVLLAVIGGGIGFAYGHSAGTTTDARILVTYEQLGQNAAVTNLGVSTPFGPTAAQLEADPIVNLVARRVGQSAATLRARMSIAGSIVPPNQPNYEVFLSVSTGNPSAKRVLRAWLDAIAIQRTARAHNLIDRAISGVQRRLAIAERKGEPGLRKVLQLELVHLMALRASVGSDVQPLRDQPKIESTSHSSLSYAGLGLLAGAVLGGALALLLWLFDKRLRTAEGLSSAFGLPLVADLREAAAGDDKGQAHEALQLIGGGTAPHSLVIVAAAPAPEAERAAQLLQAAIGDGGEVKQVSLDAGPGRIDALMSSDAVVVVASPGTVRSDDAARLRTELSLIEQRPAGLILA